ncbi:MAG: phosphoribosylglycinamide formyltransferase [Bacteroidota bacterium]
MQPPISLAIFASGGGSNAEAILQHATTSSHFSVKLIVTNNAQAGVLKRAENHGIPAMVLDKTEYRDGAYLVKNLQDAGIQMIALAGYLKLIPVELVRAFSGRMVNIHPSLLPNFGGKGMYGMRVHEAVIKAGSQRSGMTIHEVNEVYDQGKILRQVSLKVQQNWLPAQLQQAVLRLEHRFYPLEVEKVAQKLHTQTN